MGSRVGCSGEGMEHTLEPGDKRRQGTGCRGQRRRVRADKGAGRRRRGGQVLAGEGRAAGRHLEQEAGRRGAQTRTLLGFSCGSQLIKQIAAALTVVKLITVCVWVVRKRAVPVNCLK